MGGGVPERTGVLVVRAWLHGKPPVVAAHLVYTIDVSRPGRVTLAASGAAAVTAAVARWLDEFSASPVTGDASVTEG